MTGEWGEAPEPVAVEEKTDLGTAKLLPDVDRPRAWLLTVDGAPQSYVDLDEPEHLEFEYTRRLGHVVDAAAPRGAALDVLHLGGGALTLARYTAATRPGSRQTVIEADAALTALVRRHLPLRPEWEIEVHALDARAALAAVPTGSQDLVVVDVFGGSRVPAHLASAQFVREAAHTLRAEGVYAANLADSAPFAFAKAQVANVRAVFPHVCLIAEASVLRGRRFGNLVLAGSHRALPERELTRRTAGDAFPARVVGGEALELFVAGASPVADAEATASPEPPDGAFSLS
jgi:spermidine synthase